MALSTDFMPFIFGGNTGETLESIARKRAVAEALLARGGTPKNVGEGLTAVGNALASVILERRAAAAEEKGQAGAADAFNALSEFLAGGGDAGGGTGGIGTGGLTPAPPPPPAAVPPVVPSVAPRAAPAAAPPGWSPGGSFAPPAGVGAPTVGAAAPTVGASPTGLSGGKQAFVDRLMPAALELSKTTGIDPKLIIAHAALESSWGRSAPGGNYFGIKSHGLPGGNTLKTTEYYGGKPQTEMASFRAYGSPEASVRGYGDFLQQNSRYRPMLAAKGFDAQLAALDAAGYATDPDFAKKVRANAAMFQLPTQVASLDPSIGLPPAQTGVQKVAAVMPGMPPAGPEMASAGMPPVSGPGMLPPPFVPPSVPTGVMPTRGVQNVAGAMAPPPVAAPPQAAAPVQRPQQMPQAVSQQEVQAAIKVLSNQFSNAGQRAYAQEVLKRADPTYQLGLEKQRLEVDALRNKPPERQVVNGVVVERGAGGEWKPVYTAPPEAPKPTSDIQNFEYGQTHPGFTPAPREKIGDVLYERQPDGGWKAVTPAAAPGGMFGGTSVEAQGLNYLVETGQLTKDQAAQLAAGKTITGPNGEILFLTPQGVFGSAGGAVSAPYGGTGPSQPGGPATGPAPGGGPAPSPAAGNFGPGVIPITPPGKPTDAQLTTATYADRLLNAGPIIDQFEKAGLDWTNYAKADIPGWLAGGGNALIPPEFRQLAQAQRSFINAVLRRESGAVISEAEFENARKQYFPQPGDDPQTLANKRKEREIATAGFVRAAGPAYKPPAPTPAAVPSAVPFVAPKVGSPLSPGTYEWDPVTNSLRPAQ